MLPRRPLSCCSPVTVSDPFVHSLLDYTIHCVPLSIPCMQLDTGCWLHCCSILPVDQYLPTTPWPQFNWYPSWSTFFVGLPCLTSVSMTLLSVREQQGPSLTPIQDPNPTPIPLSPILSPSLITHFVKRQSVALHIQLLKLLQAWTTTHLMESAATTLTPRPAPWVNSRMPMCAFTSFVCTPGVLLMT